MDTLVQLVDQLIGSTENLAKLGAIGAWVFFTLVLLIERAWTQRAQKQASESAWEARIEEAKADDAMANAVEKLADQIRELRYKIKCGGTDV